MKSVIYKTILLFFIITFPVKAQDSQRVDIDKFLEGLSDTNAENSINDFTAQAVLKSFSEAELSSNIIGTIIKINAREGDSFSKDETLVELDCTVNLAYLEKAKAQLKVRIAENRANERLARLKAISGVEVEKSKALVEEAKAEIKLRQKTVDHCLVIAPFDGEVIKLDINEFETVRQSQPLMKIISNNNLLIEMILPSSWLSWLSEGSSFDFFVKEKNTTYRGVITKIVPYIDAVSQSVQVFAKIENSNNKLVAGMSGQAKFTPSN